MQQWTHRYYLVARFLGSFAGDGAHTHTHTPKEQSQLRLLQLRHEYAPVSGAELNSSGNLCANTTD